MANASTQAQNDLLAEISRQVENIQRFQLNLDKQAAILKDIAIAFNQATGGAGVSL